MYILNNKEKCITTNEKLLIDQTQNGDDETQSISYFKHISSKLIFHPN